MDGRTDHGGEASEVILTEGRYDHFSPTIQRRLPLSAIVLEGVQIPNLLQVLRISDPTLKLSEGLEGTCNKQHDCIGYRRDDVENRSKSNEKSCVSRSNNLKSLLNM